MNARDFLLLSKPINDCPNCLNPYIGKGEGTLEVKDDILKRTCKCGFCFEYDAKDGVAPKKVKKAIADALAAMKTDETKRDVCGLDMFL